MIENNTNFVVLHETQNYIVVDKPSPLLVHPSTPGNPPSLLEEIEALLAYDIANGATLSIINRLDRETSGVVLIAKNKETARRFGIAMQNREIKKNSGKSSQNPFQNLPKSSKNPSQTPQNAR